MAHHHDICRQCFLNVNGCACEEEPQITELKILTERKQKLLNEADLINKRIRELILQQVTG